MLNQKFVALYKESQATDPALLSRPDRPLTLAERAVVSLGGAPRPRNLTAASGMQARAGKQVVIYPGEYKTGEIITPFEKARGGK